MKFAWSNSIGCVGNNEDGNMTKQSNLKNISQKRNQLYTSTIVCAIVFFFLLLMRDTYSIGINKYIFLGITCMCAVFMKINQLIYLFCFLFPVYVGLPGNYMTLVLIVRLLFEIQRFKLSSLLLSVAVAGYVFVQNMVTGYTGIVPMMFIPGVIVVLFLFTYKQKLDPFQMILMYSAGVASLGLIMLLSTLRVYDFADLLSVSFRLGSGNVDYVSEGVMNVSMDPNFYGMFSIASISMAFPLLLQPKTKPITKLSLGAFVLIQLIVCLIGLSRAFIIVFVAWAFLYLLSQKKLKSMLVSFVVIVGMVLFLINFMPTVIETVLARFKTSDMATGNNRTTLIIKFFEQWSSSARTILFGVGMYNCNVHCMPLQFFFGGGVILFVLVTAMVLSYAEVKGRISRKWYNFLPFAVTFISMCTVPAAGLLNYMFPLVLTGLSACNI